MDIEAEWAKWQAECTNPVITEGECWPVSYGSTGYAVCGCHHTFWPLYERIDNGWEEE